MNIHRHLAAAAPVRVARSTSRTHVGRIRQVNEDRVFDCPERGLWAVADGMGGHHRGDLAAQSVIDALRDLADEHQDLTPAMVMQALEAANSAINRRDSDMGATIVTLSVHDGYAHVAWAGDSRCYRMRDGVVQLLTRDHSVVQELVDAGLITAAAASDHPQANVITRALGVGAVCDFDTCVIDVRAADRFLLCSDGLSRTLHIADLDDRPIEPLANALLNSALERDGTDNITLALVDIGPSLLHSGS